MKTTAKDAIKEYTRLLTEEPKPVKIGNTNETGECGMCGVRAKRLFPERVGTVDFMICPRCKNIMDM